MKDYYKILEVTETASAADIKKSYRKLAKKYHPDTNGGDAEATKKFEEINEAYSVLSDEAKKEKYDTERKFGPSASDQSFGGAQSSQQRTRKQAANPFAGFTSSNFKMDFGDMMFDELQKEKQTKKPSDPMDFSDVSSQFAQFFGFNPKK